MDFDEDDGPTFDLNEPEDPSGRELSDGEPKMEAADESEIAEPIYPDADASPREPLEPPHPFGAEEEQEPEQEPDTEPREPEAAEATAEEITPEVSEEERRFREEFASILGDTATYANHTSYSHVHY